MQFSLHPLFRFLLASSLMVLSSQAMSSAFQLWEQDGASVGNFHAGYAAAAEDASTAFYNPAGISRFKNQQIIFAGSSVMTSFKYKGTIQADNFDPQPQTVTAQGGNFGFLPALAYVTPLNDVLGFGFSVVVPFGLKVDYGNSTLIRYAVTKSEASVIDISPSLSIKLTDKASVGFGPDIQLMSAEFDLVGAYDADTSDTDGINNANGTGYGYHLGGLYEFSPKTRIGLSYHSQVVHHLSGKSTFTGPLADPMSANGGELVSSRARVDITLPPYTALSIYHRAHPQFAVMASAIYTQWSILRELRLQNVAGLSESLDPTTNLLVILPEFFRNTWNISLGANYYPTDKVILRAGIGYDQTPVRDDYRNVGLPDNNR